MTDGDSTYRLVDEVADLYLQHKILSDQLEILTLLVETTQKQDLVTIMEAFNQYEKVHNQIGLRLITIHQLLEA